MATKKIETAPEVDYSTMNVFKKIQAARVMFLEAGTKKSGKNMQLEFEYFELADIVPIAESIFDKVGLLMVPRIIGDEAQAVVHNLDQPSEMVEFIVPYTPVEPNRATNAMMATGSSITYIRRYLWMVVLDIVEADTIDASAGAGDKAPAGKTTANTPVSIKSSTKTKPVTSAGRQEIKQDLTNADGPADELQINGLKAALAQLRKIDPSQEEFIQTVALKTKGFKEISKKKCEELINGVNTAIQNYTQEG